MADRSKTWKREIALVGIVYVFGLGGAAVAMDSDQAVDVIRVVSLPVFGFAAAAFGIDEYAKNICAKGPRNDPGY